MSDTTSFEPYTVTHQLPPHLASWQLPPLWSWGAEGLLFGHRHYQEIVDALGRSLSLVSIPDPSHAAWLESEARHLAHRNHPAIPTTYHYWAGSGSYGRGPGYLRRWIAAETIGARVRRGGAEDTPIMLRIMREVGSALSYLHDAGSCHGAISADTVWMAPMGRLWILGWEWAVPTPDIPPGLEPDRTWMPAPREWEDAPWVATPASDQWQLAALCFYALSGERPPSRDVPPISLVRPDCPQSVAAVLDRALREDPADRFPSVAAMLRAVDRVVGSRTMLVMGDEVLVPDVAETDEVRLRWALQDDYDVLARLGSGSFGSVWRVRDLSLGREVALKLLHPHIARDEAAVSRFRREAQLAAQLAHPSIVPIYDFDARGNVSWYTMELAESGSVAELVKRAGPRPLVEIAPQVDAVLDGLAAAHAIGVIHRDLKPENIVIDRYRRWRIADFGIANVWGQEQADAAGTPAFAPPEQLLGEPQDAAADCYSTAAIVYFALSGRPPYGESDVRTILARAMQGDLHLEQFPEEIADWLRRGLDPDVNKRFQDAAVMKAAWREAVSAVLEHERKAPWWRRWLGGDDAGSLWGSDEAAGA
ncbi:MAG TPA: serine/threonine-protein kinase [Gemmatimonadaceae bacterium]|nr:serine/threonine-protein kinase [Gemmatimonadaceae bacterium]